MLNLGGLSATYPGYMAAEDQQAKTQQNQASAQEAALKLLGAQVLGRAMVGGQPGQGPQPPAPGQASVPAGGAPAAGAAPPAQGGPAAAPAPQGAPAAQGGIGELDLPTLTKRIIATTPQVQGHPEILLAALERAAPILDRQSREQLVELRKEMQTQRLSQTAELAKARLDQAKAFHDQASADKAAAEAGKNDRFSQREARLSASTAVRQDQSYQRLELQKQEAERKIQQGGDKQALSQWRAIVDAQHKRATEIIQSNSKMSDMSPEDRKALLDEQRAGYEEQIAKMRGMVSQPSPGPGTPSPAGPAAGAPGVAPPPAASAPPIAMLKAGTKTTFQNGQTWTLGPDGQPLQVK